MKKTIQLRTGLIRMFSLLSLLFAVPVILSAGNDLAFARQEQTPAANPSRPDWTGTDEINLNVSIPIGAYYRTFFMLFDANMSVNDETVYRPVKEKIRALPVIGLEYGHNFNSWLNAGIGVYYSSGSSPMVDSEKVSVGTESLHYTQILANVRFYWLNRKNIRLYSSVGAGVGILNRSGSGNDISDNCRVNVAMDIRLIGLTVGNRLYGNFQLGAMSTGLVTVGIGYRF